MNYWPVFNTNLAELFQSFADYNEAYRKRAEELATSYLKKNNPLELSKNNSNGWTIGTAANAYSITGPGGHSGPGTGGLTAKLFWEYYDFTRYTSVLRQTSYPAIKGMTEFLSTVVVKKGPFLLTDPSYSPEQKTTIPDEHYKTVGCAFDQEMIYENHLDVLKAAQILKIDNPFIENLKDQITQLDPIQIGASGQIKEDREENFYSEIGNPRHRHISQLVELYPGTIINANTPTWLDAAKQTLNLRGDLSTGWAMAHRLNAWARTKSGDRAYKIYQTLLQKGTMNNLWDTCPPFQIDGNFGGTAGVAKMLLQSHEGYIDVLPALPKEWNKGFFEGLVARGDFEISAEWKNNNPTKIFVKSKKGGICKIHYVNIGKSYVKTLSGKPISVKTGGDDFIVVETKTGDVFQIDNIPFHKLIENPKNVKIDIHSDSKISVKWDQSPNEYKYNLYIHFGDSANYELAKHNINSTSVGYLFNKNKPNLIKITSVNQSGKESEGVYLSVNELKQQ